MLKDNHIWCVGSIGSAIKKAKDVGGFSVKIEVYLTLKFKVETSSKEDAMEAIENGADIVMLDNYEVRKCF